MTTDTTEIQRIVRNYYEQIYPKKFEDLGENNKFLEKYNVPNRYKEQVEGWNNRDQSRITCHRD